MLRISCAFLTQDPSNCLEDNSYLQALKVVRGLAVCNDRAERGVALIQDYNKKLTTGEEQLQFLLQVVVDHRRRFPDCNKATFLAGQSKLP